MARTSKKQQQTDQTELQSEFVAGGNSWLTQDTLYLDTYNPLQPNFSEVTRERMRIDSEVQSSLSMLADSVFSDGIAVVPAVTDEKDEDFAEANEIAEFIKVAVSDPTRPLETVFREMFKETFLCGVKVGEIVLKESDDMLVLDRINPKPNSSVAFVTDRFYNVQGLIAVNQISKSSTGDLTFNGRNVIRRDHFLVLNFELEDNDPRGKAEIRGAFEDWCDKQDTRKQWKEWRRTSAIPKKWLVTGPGMKPKPVIDSSGKQVIENGVPKVITPEKEAMAALEGYANNSSLAVPHGTTVGQLEVQGTGQQFTTALKFNNSGIRKVIVGDALTSGEADKDARAARESAKDVSDIRKQFFRRLCQSTIKADLFRLLTIVNFGKDKAHLTPNCFLGDTEANDWATDLTAAKGAGYQFAPEHLPQLDKQFGLEPRQTIEKIPSDPKPQNQNDEEQE